MNVLRDQYVTRFLDDWNRDLPESLHIHMDRSEKQDFFGFLSKQPIEAELERF